MASFDKDPWFMFLSVTMLSLYIFGKLNNNGNNYDDDNKTDRRSSIPHHLDRLPPWPSVVGYSVIIVQKMCLRGSTELI